MTHLVLYCTEQTLGMFYCKLESNNTQSQVNYMYLGWLQQVVVHFSFCIRKQYMKGIGLHSVSTCIEENRVITTAQKEETGTVLIASNCSVVYNLCGMSIHKTFVRKL